MKRQIIRVIVLYNLDYTTGCAVREFFFAICSLDIKHTEKLKKKQYLKLVLEVVFIRWRFLSLNSLF